MAALMYRRAGSEYSDPGQSAEYGWRTSSAVRRMPRKTSVP
jgi:hypothetical protein